MSTQDVPAIVYRGPMTLIEAAESLGIDASTLRRQASNGVLHAIKRAGSWMVAPEEVERYRRTSLGRSGRPPKKRVRPDVESIASAVRDPLLDEVRQAVVAVPAWERAGTGPALISRDEVLAAIDRLRSGTEG